MPLKGSPSWNFTTPCFSDYFAVFEKERLHFLDASFFLWASVQDCHSIRKISIGLQIHMYQNEKPLQAVYFRSINAFLFCVGTTKEC